MLNIIQYNLKTQFRSVLIYLAALVGFAWMYIALFPSMQKVDIEAMMSQMPKEFQGFLGEGGASAYNTIEGFLSGEFFSFFFVLLIGFYVASVAGSAIAGKIERRTMDFELSQPVSRTGKLISDTIPAMLYALLIIFVTNGAIALLCQIYNTDINSKGLFLFSAIATLFSWAIYGIAIFVSSIIRSKIAVVGITVFIVLASYIFYALSLAVEKIRDYGKYTLYNFYDPQKILSKSQIDMESVIVFSLIFMVGIILSLVIFNKKDV